MDNKRREDFIEFVALVFVCMILVIVVLLFVWICRVLSGAIIG